MGAVQKHAWFNLGVVGLTLLVVIMLIPVLGMKRAQGGMGLLGLMGLGVLFYRGRPGRAVTDERDVAIRCRSLTVAYSAFWVVFVLTCALGAPALYGSRGSIPVQVVQSGVWVAFILVTIVDALITLLLYRRGGVSDAG